MPAIRVEKADGLGIIIFIKPETRNVFDDEFREEFEAAIDDVERDPDVRGVVITGGPEVFTAGGNVKRFNVTAWESFRRPRPLSPLFAKLEAMPKPVIAAIGGYCIGGGFTLALACDLRIAAVNARFALTEIKIGTIPGGGGTAKLQRIIGQTMAKQMILTGDMINAEEAFRMGLLNKVVPAGALIGEAKALAGRCIRHSPVALGLAKAAFNISANVDVDSALRMEELAYSMTFSSEDQKEGMNAFLEKRKPTYRGK